MTQSMLDLRRFALRAGGIVNERVTPDGAEVSIELLNGTVRVYGRGATPERAARDATTILLGNLSALTRYHDERIRAATADKRKVEAIESVARKWRERGGFAAHDAVKDATDSGESKSVSPRASMEAWK